MFDNPFMNNRRTTIDGYEFQELCGGTWEYSHTDVGYYTMLANKAAYRDNQRLGGSPFRILKRRIKKSDYDANQLRRLEISELNAKVRWLLNKPPTANRRFRIEQAQRRLNVLGKGGMGEVLLAMGAIKD